MVNSLHPPLLADPTAGEYKGWLNLNAFHHSSGAVGLVNLSCHGPPADQRSRVVGTALFHDPRHGWVGNTEVSSYDDVSLGETSIATARMALVVDEAKGIAAASVRQPESGLGLDISAKTIDAAISYEQQMPLGSGWISWRMTPRLVGTLTLSVAGGRPGSEEAVFYQDSNWGRWRWGGDIGWEWGTFLTSEAGLAVVFSRTTDRAHRRLGRPSLHLLGVGRPRRFHIVEVERAGTLSDPIRRVPGAMAALHQDRRRPALPVTTKIRASSAANWVSVEFTARAAAQLVAADPMTPGYSFIHEVIGEGRVDGEIDGAVVSGKVLGIVEHVD